MSRLEHLRSRGELLDRYSPAAHKKELEDFQDSPWTSHDDLCLQEGEIDLEFKVKATLEELCDNLNEEMESTTFMLRLSQISLELLWQLDYGLGLIKDCTKAIQQQPMDGNRTDPECPSNWLSLAIPRIFHSCVTLVTALIIPSVGWIGTILIQAYGRLQSRLDYSTPFLGSPHAGTWPLPKSLQLYCRNGWSRSLSCSCILVTRHLILDLIIQDSIHQPAINQMVDLRSDAYNQRTQDCASVATEGSQIPGDCRHSATITTAALLEKQARGGLHQVLPTLPSSIHELAFAIALFVQKISYFSITISVRISINLVASLTAFYIPSSATEGPSYEEKKEQRDEDGKDFHRDTQIYEVFSDFLHQMRIPHQAIIKRIWSERMAKAFRHSARRESQKLPIGQYLLERSHADTDGCPYLPRTIISFMLGSLQRTPRTPAPYPFSYHSILLDMNYEIIARILCFKDLELFKELTIYQFLVFQTKPDDLNMVQMLVERSNMIRNWVACELCTILDLNKRYLLIRQFINIAKMLSSNERNTFRSLERLLDVSGNMKYYRTALHEANSPGTPFLPLLLKDITFLLDGPSTFIHIHGPPANEPQRSGELVNFAKFRDLTETIEQTMRITQGKYCWKREMNSLFDLIDGRIHDWYSVSGKTETASLQWSKACEQ
ncbi:ras GEF [Basidiobolus meristosporus CBS 931.73]|uniref:Ras GEF n=1 Tax=Basidiobolus meristosporus CBS 931.73 TaxID=1314790 RepID=A0A1Y1YFP0_9FUNG|nr:ras GEF [Basidiobolus meristosporus CBS 931.73]|eukprot:ORX96819.1 ras GEF [Basidiobolus meristosporus CBS 931.73]